MPIYTASKLPNCRVKSVKIYTGQKKFTRAPPVAPVTNMRYVKKMEKMAMTMTTVTVMMTSLVMMTKMMRIKKRESIRGVHGRGGSHHCCLAEDSPASWHLPFLHHDDLLHLDHVFDHNIDHDDLSSYLC